MLCYKFDHMQIFVCTSYFVLQSFTPSIERTRSCLGPIIFLTPSVMYHQKPLTPGQHAVEFWGKWGNAKNKKKTITVEAIYKMLSVNLTTFLSYTRCQVENVLTNIFRNLENLRIYNNTTNLFLKWGHFCKLVFNLFTSTLKRRT